MNMGQDNVENQTLIDAYFDGGASDGERDQLELRLREDPEAVRAFLAAARMDRGLDVVYRRDKTPVAAVSSPIPRSRTLRILGLGACAALAVFGVFRYQSSPLTPQDVTAFVASSPPPPDPSVRPLVTAPVVPSLSTHDPLVLPLWRFDFEQTVSNAYPVWLGEEGACPPGRGGKRCLGGLRMPLRDDQFGVSLGDWKRPFLDYADDLQIRFSYWVGATTTARIPIAIVVHVGLGKEAEAFRLDAEVSGSVQWVEIQMPLSAARGWHSRTPLRPGDRIDAVHITVPFAANDVFFIDDLVIAGSAGPRAPGR